MRLPQRLELLVEEREDPEGLGDAAGLGQEIEQKLQILQSSSSSTEEGMKYENISRVFKQFKTLKNILPSSTRAPRMMVSLTARRARSGRPTYLCAHNKDSPDHQIKLPSYVLVKFTLFPHLKNDSAFSFSISLIHLRCFPSLVSPIKVDCEKVLGGDAGSPRQRRVVLHARGRDERRRRVEEGRVRARAHQFAKSLEDYG